MAENQDGQEKSEPATAKRMQEARLRGQVSKSMDVTTASMLLIGGSAVFLLGVPLIENYKNLMRTFFTNMGSFDVNFENTQWFYTNLAVFFGKYLAPIILVIFLVSLFAEISQVGLTVATKKYAEGLPFKQMNPLKGLKRIFFSGRSIFELFKSILKVSILGLVVYWVLSERAEETIGLMERPFIDIASFMVTISFEIVFKMAIVYISIAVIDYIYQKQRFKKDMMMTKQEVREEIKQVEGDPKIKARLRQLMRQRIRSLMLKNVKKADVVITNPTHFAIALSYKPGKDRSPKVVAKGLDFLALNIRQIAMDNDVPIVEEPPLARALYYSVEIDGEIPEKMFKAVAQILAYVYQLKKKTILN